MLERKWEVKKVHIATLMLLAFAGFLGVLSFIHYSNGDDAYFLQFCGEMELFEYLKWRYETWTGRMASEAIMHIFFNLDIWFWRIANATMLVLLPISLVLLNNKVALREQEHRNQSGTDEMKHFFVGIVMCFFFYLLLDIRTFGYSCIWITGSMNYLWPVVCGILALWAVASGKGYALGVVCGVIATLSSEQMGAVLLAFEIICIMEHVWKKKRPEMGLLLLTGVTLAGFAISGMAPGNELRIADSVAYYMPQFETLALGQRLFILVQWLVSSFANENAMFLVLIWVAGILLINERRKMEQAKKCKISAMQVAAGVFAGVALLGRVGVSAITDMGIDLSAMTGTVEQVPVAGDMSMVQWCALCGWFLALIFTFVLLWKVTNADILLLLTYLGAIASEMILIFSPTIYSSGERVFFLTCVMLMFLVLALYSRMREGKSRAILVGTLMLFGVANLLLQAEELIGMIA